MQSSRVSLQKMKGAQVVSKLTTIYDAEGSFQYSQKLDNRLYLSPVQSSPYLHNPFLEYSLQSYMLLMLTCIHQDQLTLTFSILLP
jgi:hypothetical protein